MTTEQHSLADAWAELARAGLTIGIDPDYPGGFMHKSLDDLLDEINDLVPEGVTPEDLLKADALRDEGMARADKMRGKGVDIHYVVEHLRQVGGTWQWVPVESYFGEAEAKKGRDDFTEQAEEMDEDSALYRVVKVTTGVVQRDVIA